MSDKIDRIKVVVKREFLKSLSKIKVPIVVSHPDFEKAQRDTLRFFGYNSLDDVADADTSKIRNYNNIVITAFNRVLSKKQGAQRLKDIGNESQY